MSGAKNTRVEGARIQIQAVKSVSGRPEISRGVFAPGEIRVFLHTHTTSKEDFHFEKWLILY